MDIHKLWAAMSAHSMGPEPIVLEVEDGEINVFTLSCMNQGAQEGLYASGRGKTLEEAVKKFVSDLEEQLGEENE